MSKVSYRMHTSAPLARCIVFTACLHPSSWPSRWSHSSLVWESKLISCSHLRKGRSWSRGWIAIATAADGAEELVIRQSAWAVIMQEECQQKTGPLRPESSMADLDRGVWISRGSSCIELPLWQKHKSNTRRSMSGVNCKWMNRKCRQSITLHFSRNLGSLQVLLEDCLTHFDFSFHKQTSSHDTRHVVFALYAFTLCSGSVRSP